MRYTLHYNDSENGQIGTSTIGSPSQPIYLNAGKLTVCDEIASLGNNLALGSALFSNINAGDWSVVEDGEYNYITITVTDSSWHECQIPLYVAQGELADSYVTVSLEYQETVAGGLLINLGAYNNSSRQKELSNIAMSSCTVDGTDGSWTRVHYTFHIEDTFNGYTYDRYKLQFKKNSGTTSALTLKVRKPKVEIGKTATDWCPSTGDIMGDVVSQVGIATVGSATKPIYLNAGVPTASSSTVGAANKFVYLSSGTITAAGTTYGGSNQPIYLSSGTVTTCNSTMPIAGSTFTGIAYAQTNTSYTTYQLRNIAFTTSTPSSLTNGNVCMVYS